MREPTPFEEALAEQCAARHRTPKATVVRPAVIVPGDEFMTEKLRDPDYVPYCGPCVLMQRLRRVIDGFECPTCGNKSNYDLTKFDGNVNVQFVGMDLAEAEARVAAWREANPEITRLWFDEATTMRVKPREGKTVVMGGTGLRSRTLLNNLMTIETCGRGVPNTGTRTKSAPAAREPQTEIERWNADIDARKAARRAAKRGAA